MEAVLQNGALKTKVVLLLHLRGAEDHGGSSLVCRAKFSKVIWFVAELYRGPRRLGLLLFFKKQGNFLLLMKKEFVFN
jgi:hypothetical protein